LKVPRVGGKTSWRNPLCKGGGTGSPSNGDENRWTTTMVTPFSFSYYVDSVKSYARFEDGQHDFEHMSKLRKPMMMIILKSIIKKLRV